MTMTGSVSSVVYAVSIAMLLGFAAWRDVATRTIPDFVSIALIGIGVVARLVQGWQSVSVSLLVALLVFIALLPLCSRGLLGGADLKLLAALAVGMPPQVSLDLLVDVTMIGGALAVTYLVLGKTLSRQRINMRPGSRPASLLSRIARVEFWRIRRGAPLPYGIAIAIGAVVVVVNHQGV